MFLREQLTANRTTLTVNLQFDPIAVLIENPTASRVFIRQGGNDIPNALNADHTVSAASQVVLPVEGRWFGIALDTPALVASGSLAISGLSTVTTVVFLDRSETIPNLGGMAFQTLSLSDLTGGLLALTVAVGAAAVRSSVFDLGAWGGLLVEVVPASSCAQGFVAYEVSNAPAGPWTRIGSWPIWAGSPFTLNLPRVARYASLVFGDAGLGGTNVFMFYSARASLSEILNVAFTSTGPESTIPFSQAAGVVNTYYIYTLGLDYISLSFEYVTFTPGDDTTYIVRGGPSLAGPWRPMLTETQEITLAFGSFSQGFSDLSSYLEITIGNTVSSAFLQAGNIRFRARSQDPTSSLLGRISKNIGSAFMTDNSLFNYLSVLKYAMSTRQVKVTQYVSVVGPAGVWTNTGIDLPTNVLGFLDRIVGIDYSGQPSQTLIIAVGTAVVQVTNVWYGLYVTGGSPMIERTEQGIVYPATNRRLWIFHSAAVVAEVIDVYTTYFGI